jgi:5-oxoprolinase (ATP-hydrolysing)
MTVTKPMVGGIRIAIGTDFKYACTTKNPTNDSANYALLDRGGTFTDVWASLPGKPDVVLKLLSVDPGNYADAPTEGKKK